MEDKDLIKAICKYERLMFMSHNIDSAIGQKELMNSVDRVRNYFGRRPLSLALRCEKDEVDFVLRNMIINENL